MLDGTEGALSRADVIVDINQRQLLIDVVITHATAASRIGAAPKKPGAIATAAAEHKIQALAQHHVAHPGTMLSFSMETTGYYTKHKKSPRTLPHTGRRPRDPPSTHLVSSRGWPRGARAEAVTDTAPPTATPNGHRAPLT